MRRATLCLVLAGFFLLPAVAAASAPPTIANGTPTEIRNREATLHFTIDPEGLATKYYVEYGTTTGYGQQAELYEGDAGSGDDPVPLDALLSVWYLKPATTYHYRVVASNAAGTTYGDDAEVTTANGTLPTVVTGAAEEDTGSSVVLHGTVDPEGQPLTACRFHYVTLAQYERFGFTYSVGPRPEPQGVQVPCEETPAEIGSGTDPVPVHAEVSYTPGWRYYRLEAENAYDEAAPGAAAPFGSEPPAIEYLAPDPLRNESATLRFKIYPNRLDTEYEVEYGDEAGNYNEFHYLWDGTVPAGEEPVTREAKLPAYWEGSLWPGTTYHWRVVARNAAGTTEGPDETFTTPDELPPALTTSVTEATVANTHFTGTVDPEGHELTGCRFRWLPVGLYDGRMFEWHDAIGRIRLGFTVPCVESLEEIGSGSEPVAVHADVSGLEPGLHYVRLEAENAYEDGADWAGIPFEIPNPNEVGKGCEHDPGCGPPATKPPVVTPPQATPRPPAKKKKKHKKNRRRAHRNAGISARR